MRAIAINMLVTNTILIGLLVTSIPSVVNKLFYYISRSDQRLVQSVTPTFHSISILITFAGVRLSYNYPLNIYSPVSCI